MSVNYRPGCPLGTHRALDPVGSLPQPAWRIDNDPAPYDNEIAIDVRTLNVDAASFTQMAKASGGDPAGVARLIMDTVSQRGKQHNPVTGSGGMLIGVVRDVGPRHPDFGKLKPGDKLVTIV